MPTDQTLAGGEAGEADPAREPADAAHRHFYDHSAVPTITIDLRARRIVDANPAAVGFLGIGLDRLRTMRGADLLSEPTPEETLRVRGLRGDPTRVIRTVETAFGRRTAEINQVPAGPDGLVFVQAVDLTDVLAANEALERQTVRLRRVSDALASVASQIGHDVRDSLASITGMAQMLRERDENLPPELRAELLERLEAGSRALGDLVGAMVSDARDPALDLDTASQSVPDLFGLLEAMFAVQLGALGGELALHAGIDAIPVPIAVLRQPLVNLVGNSIRYREPTRPLRIVVEIRHTGADDPAGPATEVVVSDNGAGLAGDDDTIFEPGVRGLAASGTEGTGAGLDVVRETVTALGGTVAAEARDRGAAFRIRIPDAASPPPGVDGAEASDPSRRSLFGGTRSTGLTAAQLDSILDVAPVPTLILELVARSILRVNAAAVALFGRPAEDLVGTRGAELLTDPAIGDAMRARLLAGPDATATATDTRIQGPDGAVPVRIHLTTVPGTTLAMAQIVERDDLS